MDPPRQLFCALHLEVCLGGWLLESAPGQEEAADQSPSKWPLHRFLLSQFLAGAPVGRTVRPHRLAGVSEVDEPPISVVQAKYFLVSCCTRGY